MLLLPAALSAPVIEIPVESVRDAGRKVRQLADMGLSASVVRVGGKPRVRLDTQPEDAGEARSIADRVGAELGVGALVFADGTGPSNVALATTAAPSLEEQLRSASAIRFRYSRELSGTAILHDWIRDGEAVTVAIDSSGGDHRDSRLLLTQSDAVLWSDAGRQSASREQLGDWIMQLSPEQLLEGALRMGFGGTVRPKPGCRDLGDHQLCLGEPATQPSATVFVGAHRTAAGRWLPARIEWYSAGNLEDRIDLLELSFPDELPDHWFDAENGGMRIEP